MQTLAAVLKFDAIAIDALLLATLQDHVKYKQLVKRRGQEAQALLNLLQAVCLSASILYYTSSLMHVLR